MFVWGLVFRAMTITINFTFGIVFNLHTIYIFHLYFDTHFVTFNLKSSITSTFFTKYFGNNILFVNSMPIFHLLINIPNDLFISYCWPWLVIYLYFHKYTTISHKNINWFNSKVNCKIVWSTKIKIVLKSRFCKM